MFFGRAHYASPKGEVRIVSEEATLQERVEKLEATISDLHQRLDEAVSRDIPLLMEAIRTIVDAGIEDIGKVPDAGRLFYRRMDEYDDFMPSLESRVLRFHDIGGEQSSKAQKIAAVLSYTVNQCYPD